MRSDAVIRPATTADIVAITEIYADAVRTGTGTFELEPPDQTEMAARHARVLGGGHSFLVAATGDAVLGYAYTSPFRERAAYRFTVETSVYVARGARGGGVGRALLAALVAAATDGGFRQIVAVIGDSANAGSIRLHAGAGFAHAGVLRAAGWKAGRWIDAVLMQRALGEGDTTPAARQSEARA